MPKYLKLFCFFAATWAGFGPEAAAQGPAKGLLAEGISRFKKGQFERSVRLLRRASGDLKDPERRGEAQLYLGLNYLVLKDKVKARGALERALSLWPGVKLDPERYKPEFVSFLASVRQGIRGTLRVTGPPKCEVFLDSAAAGPTPLEVQLPVGEHLVEVRHPRGDRYRERVLVARGRDREVRAQFAETAGTPAAGDPAGTPAAGDPASTPAAASTPAQPPAAEGSPANSSEVTPGQPPAAEGSPAASSRVPPGQDAEPPSRRRAVLGYAALGLGLACAAGGGVLLGLGVSQGSEAHDAYQNEASRSPGPDRGRAQGLYDDIDAARAKVAAGAALAGVSLAALSAAVYLLVTDPARAEDRPALAVGPARRGLVFSLSGGF